jgi:hypothetical protein
MNVRRPPVNVHLAQNYVRPSQNNVHPRQMNAHLPQNYVHPTRANAVEAPSGTGRGDPIVHLVWLLLNISLPNTRKNTMRRKPYMPNNAEGIDQMLVAFDTNINANAKALAIKYSVADDDLTRVTQARLVWGWFMDALSAARTWAKSLTETRDMMETAPQNSTQPLPGGPMLPAVPQLPTTRLRRPSWSRAFSLSSPPSWAGSRITRLMTWPMASFSGSRARR